MSTPSKSKTQTNILGIVLCVVALIAIGLYKSSRKKEIRESVINDVLSTQKYTQNDTFLNSQSLPAFDSNQGQINDNPVNAELTTTVVTDTTNKSSNTISINKEEDISANVSLPSKEETEKWLLSKLNDYSDSYLLNPPNSSPPTVAWYLNSKPVFSFDDYYLIISSTIKQTNEKFAKSERPKIIKIPIYDIGEISNSNFYTLSLKTNKKTIIEIRDNGIETIKSVDDYESFHFKCNAETDLVDRLKKAFFHLKKFYEAPKKNEVF